MSDAEFQKDSSWRTEAGREIYVIIIVLSSIMLLLDIKLSIKEIYYVISAKQEEGNYYSDTKKIYFTAENGEKHTINIVNQPVKHKEDKVNVYYFQGKENKAIVLSTTWWYIVTYSVFGVMLIFGIRGYKKNK